MATTSTRAEIPRRTWVHSEAPCNHLGILPTPGRAALTSTFDGSRKDRHVALIVSYRCTAPSGRSLLEEHPRLALAPSSNVSVGPRLPGRPRNVGHDAEHANDSGVDGTANFLRPSRTKRPNGSPRPGVARARAHRLHRRKKISEMCLHVSAVFRLRLNCQGQRGGSFTWWPVGAATGGGSASRTKPARLCHHTGPRQCATALSELSGRR